MKSIVSAVRLLLEQQARHGDAVFSEKSKRAINEIDKEYGELDKMFKDLGGVSFGELLAKQESQESTLGEQPKDAQVPGTPEEQAEAQVREQLAKEQAAPAETIVGLDEQGG